MHIVTAVAPAAVFADSKSSGGAAGFLLPAAILLFAVIMFTTSRRNRRRAAEAAQVVMQPGAEIVTRSGMLGTVVDATDNEVTIEVAPGVHIKMLPAAVISRDDPSIQRTRGYGRRSAAAAEPAPAVDEAVREGNDEQIPGSH